MKVTPGDTIILQLRITNDDHMMYGQLNKWTGRWADRMDRKSDI